LASLLRAWAAEWSGCRSGAISAIRTFGLYLHEGDDLTLLFGGICKTAVRKADVIPHRNAQRFHGALGFFQALDRITAAAQFTFCQVKKGNPVPPAGEFGQDAAATQFRIVGMRANRKNVH